MQVLLVRPMTLAEQYDGAVAWRCQLNCDSLASADYRAIYQRSDGVKLAYSCCRRCAERESLETAKPLVQLT